MKRKKTKFKSYYHTNTYYGQYVGYDYVNEQKYLDKLSTEEAQWLDDFLKAHYFRTKSSFDKLNFSTKQRRESYNQHRGVCQDIFHRNLRADLQEIHKEEEND